MISIQKNDFDLADEYKRLREQSDSDGAIVTFTGLVRDFSDTGSVSTLFIEHYPGMTEKTLEAISDKAQQRWDLGQVRIIHRVGYIKADEQIVFVGVSAKHRKDAFESAQFIMDFLKNDAPFWKQEGNAQGMQWVDQKQTDIAAAKRW
mgnify:CR=1 FL=1